MTQEWTQVSEPAEWALVTPEIVFRLKGNERVKWGLGTTAWEFTLSGRQHGDIEFKHLETFGAPLSDQPATSIVPWDKINAFLQAYRYL